MAETNRLVSSLSDASTTDDAGQATDLDKFKENMSKRRNNFMSTQAQKKEIVETSMNNTMVEDSSVRSSLLFGGGESSRASV